MRSAFLHLFSIILCGIWLNYWNFALKHCIWHFNDNDSCFIRTWPSVFGVSDDKDVTQRWISQAYLLNSSPTDWSYLYENDQICCTILFLFISLTFFVNYFIFNKVFSGDLFQTLMTQVMNLCLVAFVRTMKRQNNWDEFQTSCAIRRAEVFLRTLSKSSVSLGLNLMRSPPPCCLLELCESSFLFSYR